MKTRKISFRVNRIRPVNLPTGTFYVVNDNIRLSNIDKERLLQSMSLPAAAPAIVLVGQTISAVEVTVEKEGETYTNAAKKEVTFSKVGVRLQDLELTVNETFSNLVATETVKAMLSGSFAAAQPAGNQPAAGAGAEPKTTGAEPKTTGAGAGDSGDSGDSGDPGDPGDPQTEGAGAASGSQEFIDLGNP